MPSVLSCVFAVSDPPLQSMLHAICFVQVGDCENKKGRIQANEQSCFLLMFCLDLSFKYIFSLLYAIPAVYAFQNREKSYTGISSETRGPYHRFALSRSSY